MYDRYNEVDWIFESSKLEDIREEAEAEVLAEI